MPGRMMSRNGEGRLERHLRSCERRFLAQEVMRSDGNTTKLARELGLSRRGLYRRLIDLGIDELAPGRRARHGVQGPRRRRREEPQPNSTR